MVRQQPTYLIQLRIPANLYIKILDLADLDEVSINKWLIKAAKNELERLKIKQDPEPDATVPFNY